MKIEMSKKELKEMKRLCDKQENCLDCPYNVICEYIKSHIFDKTPEIWNRNEIKFIKQVMSSKHFFDLEKYEHILEEHCPFGISDEYCFEVEIKDMALSKAELKDTIVFKLGNFVLKGIVMSLEFVPEKKCFTSLSAKGNTSYRLKK